MPTNALGIRHYRAGDVDIALAFFQRSVLEVASRDYTPVQIEAWTGDIDTGGDLSIVTHVIHQGAEFGRHRVAARVVEVESGKRRQPVIEHRDQLAALDIG